MGYRNLFEGTDARGTRAISATLDGEGLRIDGQDLGPQVQAFGPDFREYEWSWKAARGDVPRIVELLGGQPGEDALDVLERWTKEHNGLDPGNFLKGAGVELAFWSRVGE